jgi:hypothetical protein
MHMYGRRASCKQDLARPARVFAHSTCHAVGRTPTAVSGPNACTIVHGKWVWVWVWYRYNVCAWVTFRLLIMYMLGTFQGRIVTPSTASMASTINGPRKRRRVSVVVSFSV